MDKQELENRVLNPGFNNKITVNGKNFTREDKVLNLIDQLDEPKKEVLPKAVAEYLDYLIECGENEDFIVYSLCIYAWGKYTGEVTEVPDEILDWLPKFGNTTKLINALRNGYESEKTEYLVKVGNDMYFKDWGEDNTEPTFIIDDAPGFKEMAMRFKYKNLAESVAETIGGEIEEV